MTPAPEGETDAAERTAQAFAQMRDVNEQLVLSAVRAQVDAEASAQQLADVSRAAELDVLTSLPNRALLADRMKQALAAARRHGNRVALLFVDLNDFKLVNDTLGHSVGDQVLCHAATRLLTAVRAADTVCRHGGDEFLILLTDIAQPSDALVIVEKIHAVLNAPVLYGSHVVRLTASIGITVFPDDGTAADVLIDRADVAMYRAKRRGGPGHAFHSDEVSDLERQAVKRGVPTLRLVTPLVDAQAEYDRRHEELREANEQLVLAALSAQLLQQHAEDEQRKQSDFIAMLAHELRNPLAPMYNVAALLARVKPDDAIIPKLQSIIERQVGHMSRMVDDLLDVTRVTTGKLRLDFTPTDLSVVFTRAVEQRQAALDLRLQRFTSTVPLHAVVVPGDADRLVQVVSNLLDNASKYTQNGGEVGLTLTVENAQAIIVVRDSGIGISAEALPHIFDLFTQDRHAVGFNGAGLGIGLTVVQELVTAHRGTVTARSAGIGQGSEFIVTLPLLTAHVGS